MNSNNFKTMVSSWNATWGHYINRCFKRSSTIGNRAAPGVISRDIKLKVVRKLDVQLAILG